MGENSFGKSHSLSLMGVGLLVAALLVDPIAGGIGAAMELSGGAFFGWISISRGGAIASGGWNNRRTSYNYGGRGNYRLWRGISGI